MLAEERYNRFVLLFIQMLKIDFVKHAVFLGGETKQHLSLNDFQRRHIRLIRSTAI